MSTIDTKERNFCFVYKGEALQPTLFESLYFQSAEGAYCREDGMWYVRVSLDRNHGRRAINVPNILEDYNEKVQERDRVVPAHLPQMASAITCFKTAGPSSNNHILCRIKADSKTNPTYWRWDHKKLSEVVVSAGSTTKLPKSKSKAKQPLETTPVRTGLEGLARELSLDPNGIDMQGAYAAISRNYFAATNTALPSSGQFNASDRDFLLNQLSRYFSKEMAFVAKPFGVSSGGKQQQKHQKTAGTIAALVAVNGGISNDFEFICADPVSSPKMELNPFVPAEPNESICTYFRQMLPNWLSRSQVDHVEIAVRDIVTALNGGNDGGTYRSTCIPGFLRPFVSEGLIKPVDKASARPSRYIVDVKGMAEKLSVV
jgi:hypothetical protein